MTQRIREALEPLTGKDVRAIRERWEQLAIELGWDGRDVRIRLDDVKKIDASSDENVE